MDKSLISGAVPFSRSILMVPYVAKLGTMCAFCYKEGDSVKLSRCGRCKRLSYCSRSCQKAHWTVHRSLCKGLADANKVIKELSEENPDICASQMHESSVLSMPCTTVDNAETERRLQLRVQIQHGIHCSVCHKTPIEMEDETWKTCPKCNYGWCCQRHWASYKPKHSKEICETFQKLHGIARFQLNHMVKYDEFFSFLPCDTSTGFGYFNPTVPTGFFINWTEYFKARFPSYHGLRNNHRWFFDADTSALSQICTLFFGMAQFGMEKFNRESKLCVHVVGAGSYELHHVDAWEEMLHFFPQLRELTIHCIGPEMTDCKFQTGFDTCPTCVGNGSTLTFKYSPMTYHECRDSDDGWQHPDVLIACNTGLGEEFTESWKSSLKEIIRLNIPSIFTSYTEGEATEENLIFEELGANRLHKVDGVMNPFHDQLPYLEETGVDVFYYQNYYITCFQGSL